MQESLTIEDSWIEAPWDWVKLSLVSYSEKDLSISWSRLQVLFSSHFKSSQNWCEGVNTTNRPKISPESRGFLVQLIYKHLQTLPFTSTCLICAIFCGHFSQNTGSSDAECCTPTCGKAFDDGSFECGKDQKATMGWHRSSCKVYAYTHVLHPTTFNNIWQDKKWCVCKVVSRYLEVTSVENETCSHMPCMFRKNLAKIYNDGINLACSERLLATPHAPIPMLN